MSGYKCEIKNAEQALRYAKEIEGKVVLVTGGTLGGLGAEFATHLAQHSPKLVILTARNQQTLDETFPAIDKVANGNAAPLKGIILDLSSFDSVRKAAAEINGLPETIDVLVHNAGVGGLPNLLRNENGIELQLATNHVGPFLLTKLLLPKMISQSPRPRVVSIAGSFDAPGYPWEDPNCLRPETYSGLRYSQTKILNLLFSAAGARRGGSHVDFVSCSPGWVYTGLPRHLSVETKKQMGSLPLIFRLAADETGYLHDDGRPNLEAMDPLDKGCASYFVAAFDKTIPQVDNGGWIASDSTLATDKLPDYARGQALEDRMWAMTEELLHEQWDLAALVKSVD